MRQTPANTDISRESSRGNKLGDAARQLIIIICDYQGTLRATFCNYQTRKKVECVDYFKFVTMLESSQELQWEIQFQISSSTKLSTNHLEFSRYKTIPQLKKSHQKANVFTGFTSKKKILLNFSSSVNPK
jgi:hypothetical protein